MRIEKLYEGMRVIIKDYPEDDIPEHWNENGEMNEWAGRAVTIKSIDHTDGGVYIEEDGEHWCFHACDFFCQVFSDAEKKNPNFLFTITTVRRS